MFKALEFKNKKQEVLRGVVFEGKEKTGIVFIHGFERKSSEKKFKNILDEIKRKYYSFFFDFSGCGLSDGSFKDLTVKKLTNELDSAINIFCEKFKLDKILLVAHSLGCAVVLNYLKDNISKVSKVVFLAPGLNQKELQKYWFVKRRFKEKEITWENFKEYFDSNVEKSYMEDINIPERETKEHVLSNEYFLENVDIDYQDILKSPNNILIVHGDADDKVPIASNDKLPENIKTIVVEKGDHDLEKPSIVKKYLQSVIEFLN